MIIVPVEKKIDWRRPPLVLIALVVLNVLIFAFYQSGDDDLALHAIEHYQQYDMLETEWRAYKAYARDAELPYEVDKRSEYAAYQIVMDPGFDRFMAERGRQYIPKLKREQWNEARKQLESITGRISSNAFGFHSDDISVVQLLSTQFLHGSIMHLLGNMVFLILVGFAVEAALGSWVFLAYYLVSGVGAALLFAALSASGGGALIGASGSISGVMAMYVVLFGLRKIEFFYWIFVFTGYIRAAAIVMLPVYILKEIHSYMTLEGSNVAFTAHIGGFVTGAVLVWVTRQFRSEVIDDDYLDNKPEVTDRIALAVQRIYDQLGQCEFEKAWEMLKPIKQNNPNRSDIVELEYHLVRAYHPRKLQEYLVHRMGKPNNPTGVVTAQLSQWKKLNTDKRERLSLEKQSALLGEALGLSNLEVAEDIFKSMRQRSQDFMQLAASARQLSAFCHRSNRQDKADRYSGLAQELANPSYAENRTNTGGQS